jgi:tight adherence protein C
MPVVSKKIPKSSIARLSYYDVAPQKSDEVRTSLFERVIAPIFIRIASIVKRAGPAGMVESTRHQLGLAGILENVGVDVFLAVKILFPIGFLFLFIILVLFLTLPLIAKILLFALIPLSYFFPNFYLRRRINRRKREIRRELPNALDMLTISVEAGMGFDLALSRVASNMQGALRDEFNKMLQEISVGFSRKDAFKNLINRTDVPDLNVFIMALIQADIFGVSVGNVLRVQASEMRTRRRQEAEERGVKAPVKLVFPLILCIFPTLMTVILGPAIIKIYYTLIQVLFRP